MNIMTPEQFIEKWAKIQSQAAQTHFNDICALVGHPDPVAYGKPDVFNFEAATDKTTGRADVYFEERFIWEYKGPHANLDKAYQQLLLYREALGNPPLLITSDMRRIIIHTNYTNTPKQVYEIRFERLLDDGLGLLKRIFHDPPPMEFFRPPRTKQEITQATADNFVAVTGILQSWARAEGRTVEPERIVHFTIRLLFCLFADSMGLLPDNIFKEIVSYDYSKPEHFAGALRNLFMTMRDGGLYGHRSIFYFDGGLFDDDFVPENLPPIITSTLIKACQQDWSAIDPSIFGTLFERVIDETKRSQLGAHYTGFDDILLIVEPVLMQPYREKWESIKRDVRKAVRTKLPNSIAGESLQQFADELASIRVLDPACGSGNFLYVALQQLLSLQKEVIAFTERHELPPIPLTVGPHQLYGIEMNLHAYELAQITAWIGYIQWRFENGFEEIDEPILRPLNNIQHKDAILAYDESGQPVEPTWPVADVVIGNPPFLGSRKMRPELGDAYCDSLLKLYKNQIEGMPDLVCYWFDKTQRLIAQSKLRRAGLLATQAIRGGTNRRVLDRIVEAGQIFMAWSDRNWTLDGATVHVSLVGFDDGSETNIYLDGERVTRINSDLTKGISLTAVKKLAENAGLSFQGVVPRGRFYISHQQAQKMLQDSNNREVIKPKRTGKDIVSHCDEGYVIDFGVDISEIDAARYIQPYAYLKKHVYPERQKANQVEARQKWWLHWNPRIQMRQALSQLSRYIATPRVGKHRIFVWLDSAILPDNAVVVFARADDYFFGVLHSKIHELWSRRMGTQLRDAVSGFRYTSTTTFETFPLPYPPDEESGTKRSNAGALEREAIAEMARALVEFRQKWLQPVGVGIDISQAQMKKRTLTNLYNALDDYRQNIKDRPTGFLKWGNGTNGIITLDEIEELHEIHVDLDEAVLQAYGWPHGLSDEQILERLLALNLSRK